jgi:hypothetical protein
MAGLRRSGRAVKPKQYFESTPYPTRKPRNAPPKPQKVLQPVLAEDTPPPDSDLTDAPLEFPLFEPLDIKPHNTQILVPEGISTPFKLFSVFFCPELLMLLIGATNSYARRNHKSRKNP